MADRKLKTVPYRPNAAKATVIDCRPDHTGPYFEGEGQGNLLCGNCGNVLVRGGLVALMMLYICCPICGMYNLADGGSATSDAGGHGN